MTTTQAWTSAFLLFCFFFFISVPSIHQNTHARHTQPPSHSDMAADGEDGDDTTLPDDPVASAALADAVEAAAPADARALATFSAVVARAPSQVLRYCFHADARPIWPRASPRPPRPASVPPCPRCGGPRAFELHILPQVLACLGRDAADPRAPDFAAAGVWSCARSCAIGSGDGGSAYAEEYVWVQAGDGQE